MVFRNNEKALTSLGWASRATNRPQTYPPYPHITNSAPHGRNHTF
uniref:Uncharacterized protein n=1 Tax=Anguilla anguilla TaxID=7936 RepID=A0A0E9WJS3_ANGAN